MIKRSNDLQFHQWMPFCRELKSQSGENQTSPFHTRYPVS